jgi:hypothetical protein
MTRALSKSAALAAAVVLAGVIGPAEAAPKPHRPPAAGGYAAPAPPVPLALRPVVYGIEQLVTGSISPVLQAQMAPVHTLREVEDLLKANDVAFKWNKIEMRSADLPPEMVKQIAALPPGEVFVVPQGSPPGQIMVFNVILNTRPE